MVTEDWILALTFVAVWMLGIFIITLSLDTRKSEYYWYPIMAWPLVIALMTVISPVFGPYLLARKIRRKKEK